MWKAKYYLVILINILASAEVWAVKSEMKKSSASILRIAVFDIDATPRLAGSKMAFGNVINDWDLGLRAKGLIIMGAGKSMVLCAIDWVGIASEDNDRFRSELAEAAGTVPERVVLHALHQHDAPWGSLTGTEAGSGTGFANTVLQRIKVAINKSLEKAQEITHVGFGEAEVFKVASNRSLFHEDGSFWTTR